MSFDRLQPSYIDFRAVAAERTTPIIAWTGSGLSAPAGLPTWPTLRNKLIATAESKAASFEESEHDRQRLSTLIERAMTTSDNWLAFDILRRALGPTSYRQTIRDVLAPATTAPIPPAYMEIWKLHFSGVINLNLDRLATRAFTEARPGIAPKEFNGSQTANWLHILKSTHPFIVNMHGIAEDLSSWVLTKEELQSLFETPGYREFLASCFATSTILFIGLSADDVSVGGHLERFASYGIDTGTHYWLTSRIDTATDEWAERVGVRIIRYNAPENDHSAVSEFFEDIRTFLPTEDPPKPVALPVAPPIASLPAPKELRREDSETIRNVLNARAAEILRSGAETEYEEFDRFCREYGEAVYRAWYVDITEGADELLGYLLLEEAGRGAFGTVYRAQAPDGEIVAVKILHQEIRKMPEAIQSFRRGVRSMRILSDANIEGIVKYIAASEIPTFVVMEWIDGPNLRAVVQANQLSNWDEILRITCTLTDIIRKAHMLPDRVLHRDLRPANIMLENYWSDPYNWRLVVLDFDLSYHLGSKEKTIELRGDSATGYLAPEQLQKIPGVSTRNAAVDSFGLGMTFFFLLARRDPLPTEHMHTNWPITVNRACRALECTSWISLPQRFSRIIENCTCNQQAERWDLSQIAGELSRLQQVLNDSTLIPSAELLAEELVARTFGLDRYKWSEDTLSAEVELASGLTISVAGDEPYGRLVLKASWAGRGIQERRAFGKWLPTATRAASEQLKSHGWNVEVASSSGQTASINATIDVQKVFGNLQAAATAIDTLTKQLTYK